jgi:hypothetical protein
MFKKPAFWIVAAIAAFTAFLVAGSLSQSKVRVEACVEFRGRTECRTASGPSEEQAQRTAVQTACAVLASGMTDSMDCDRTPPKSVKRLN